MSVSRHIPASFDADARNVVTADRGQLVHAATVEHMERLVERLYEVRPGAWCMVGNGLSNQTFVEGPEGLIAIDTGESVEEMSAALAAVREHTNAPIAAVIYTHFHYCNGTTAIEGADAASSDLPIWGHVGIEGNLARIASEVGPVAGRGLIHQFGMMLPADGPDGLVGGGLGRFYKNPAHGRGTPGHLPVNQFIDAPVSTTIAGLRVDMTPAPTDADDNINIFFPELGLCVNNLVWPALFNVFAIRGEEYRDPRVLLAGFDEILAFGADHLVCAHGPPISGADEIAAGVTDARDAIQFLWDQTVRGINRGLTLGELIADVQLPSRFDRTYLTQQHYGLVEHHVRQIHAGLRGWFDGLESELFPLPTIDRTTRLIEGFGGRVAVLDQARSALADDDLRWALELATWLVRSEEAADGRADGGSETERALLAEVLRAIGSRTMSANIRNWCMTRALELNGDVDFARFRGFRASRGAIANSHAATFVHGLKVVLNPHKAEGVVAHVAFELDGERHGLNLRDGVAVPTDGVGAEGTVSTTRAIWGEVLSGKLTFSEAVEAGQITIDGAADLVRHALACFDIESLAS